MNYYVGNCTLSEEQKANLTNTYIHITASWACSYMYTCTNMQVMVDVQYCWGIDIFSPIIIFKIFSSETVKLTSTALYEEGWLFFSSWVQPRNEDWMRECSLTALQFSTTLYSESPITYLLLDFYTTKKKKLQPLGLCLGELPIKMPLVWLQSISYLTFISIKLKGLPRIFTITIWKR